MWRQNWLIELVAVVPYLSYLGFAEDQLQSRSKVAQCLVSSSAERSSFWRQIYSSRKSNKQQIKNTMLDNRTSINPRTYTQSLTPTAVQEGGGGELMEPLSFGYVAVFRNEFTFSGKPLVFLTRWVIFYGWWRCWRLVMSRNMVANLAPVARKMVNLTIC